MLSQKNVLQVLVSTKTGPHVTPGTALADLADGEIALFDAVTNLSIASGDGYFALNNGGKIIKSNPVAGADTADVKAYAAPVAHEETIAIVAPTDPEYFHLAIHLKGGYVQEDHILKGVYKSKTGDDATAIADALVASLNASIARIEGTPVTVSATTGTITVVAQPKPYAVGKKNGGYYDFEAILNHPVDQAKKGTVTVAGSAGVGVGQFVHTKEFFAHKNQDAVSHNHFNTGFDYTYLSSPSGTYNVLSYANKRLVTDTAVNVEAVTNSVLLAFDSAGAAPSV